jgi:hypothetical protein
MASDSNLTVQQFAQQNPSAFTHVGDYYYTFIHDQAACQNNKGVEDQNQANNTVQDLVAKLEPTN